jgi:hypothetical protein
MCVLKIIDDEWRLSIAGMKVDGEECFFAELWDKARRLSWEALDWRKGLKR